MAYTSTVGEVLAQRLGAQGLPLQARAAQGLSPLLGPVLAAPIATRPQLSVADLLAGQGAALRSPPPAPAPAPQPALNAGLPAGSALPTGAGGDPMQALSALIEGLSPAAQAPTAAPTDPRIGAGINMNGDVLQQNAPAPQAAGPSPFDQATAWLSELFGGEPAASPSANASAAAALGTLAGGAPSPLQPPETSVAAAPLAAPAGTPAPNAPSAPAQGRPAPAVAPQSQAPVAGALQTAQAEQQAMRQEKASQAGAAVSAALAKSNPDLPKEEASAVKSVFENEDLYKMMIATGAALDSGMSYGEAMLAGSQAFLGSQDARQKKAEQEAAAAAARAQQDFENRLEVAKLDKGKLKEQAEIKLAEARTRAVEAGIPLNDARLKLIQAQTTNAAAQAARANRDTSGSGGEGGSGKGGISKKDYTKFVLDEKNRIEMNGEEVPEGLTGDQWARIRVNVAAGPDQAQYVAPSTDVKERVNALAIKAQKSGLTAEEKQELGWYSNLYGDEF